MPRRCTICRHPQHEEIAVSLLRDGTRATARHFQISLPALDRHKKHLPRTIIQARQDEAVFEATSLLTRVEHLMQELDNIVAAAKQQKDWTAAISALREARNCLELLGKLTGELHRGAQLQIGMAVNVSPQEAGGVTEVDLEIAIAEHVAAATNNFDPQEIARLRTLLELGANSHASERHGCPELPHSTSPI